MEIDQSTLENYLNQIRPNWFERRTLKDYQEIFNRFLGLDLIKHITVLPDNSAVLDLGCGRGHFALNDIATKRGDLFLAGVTYPFDQPPSSRLQGSIIIFKEDMNDFLKRNNLQFELIVSVQTLKYAFDPLNTIAQAYESLSPQNGTLVIDAVENASMPIIDSNNNLVNPQELAHKLRELGYNIRIVNLEERNGLITYYSVQIIRGTNHNSLYLPIQIVSNPDNIDNPYMQTNPIRPNYCYQLTV